MARRSTRLRERVSSTPQPQKVSYVAFDNALTTPKTAPKLSSLAESDEMPGAFPRSVSPAENTPTRLAKHIAVAVTGGHYTPKHATPIKPSPEEMHPKQFQMSTAKPMQEARWLGFSSMAPHTEPPKGSNKLVPAPDTPTKVIKPQDSFASPDFQFTFNRQQSLELSDEARKMMAEKRVEAAKIREQMAGSEQEHLGIDSVLGRKMATPKSKAGRFSDVHMAHFKQMDSIASHPTLCRTPQPKPAGLPSLKRSPSKADLAPAAPVAGKSLKRTQSKTDLSQHKSGLVRSDSTKSPSSRRDDAEQAGPAKRVRRAVDDDAATSRPKEGSSSEGTPATPRENKIVRPQAPASNMTAATPTKAFLARQASIKSNKSSMIPSLSRSPSKSAVKPTTPLLARSPSKMVMSKSTASEPAAAPSPLLARSPSKHLAKDKPTVNVDMDSPATKIPLLARSPSKPSITEHANGEEPAPKTPLLARSPSKMTLVNPFAAENAPVNAGSTKLMSRFNLLRASPIKSILRSPARLYSNDPSKVASGTHFATPPKHTIKTSKPFAAAACLTEPVRKHVDFTASTKGQEETPLTPDTPSKTPPSKDEHKTRAQATFSYPSLPTAHEPVDEPVDEPVIQASKKFNRRMTLGAATPGDFTFRVATGISFAPSPNATNPPRAASIKPSIRAVVAEPEPPLFLAQPAIAPAIMHAQPPAAPQPLGPIGNKKRKLSDSAPNRDDDKPSKHAAHVDDKENKPERAAASPGPSARPAKRSKPSFMEPTLASLAPNDKKHAQQSDKPPTKTPVKLPTLGVKPKGGAVQKSAGAQKSKPAAGGRPSMMSQARLNMLAMPKHR